MKIRGMKRGSLPLVLLLALQTPYLVADQTITGNLTVTGTTTLEGNADIEGNTISLGTRIDNSQPGWGTIYTDGTTSSLEFDATRGANIWKWQQNAANSLQPQMTLDNTNALKLYNSSGTVSITLNPTGTSTFSNALVFNGSYNEMPNQTLFDGNSVVTESLGDGRYLSSGNTSVLKNNVSETVSAPYLFYQQSGSAIPVTIDLANGGAPAALNLIGPYGGAAPIEFNNGTAGSINTDNGGPFTISAASGQDILLNSPLFVYQAGGSTIPVTIDIANGGAPAALDIVGPFGEAAPIEFNNGTAGSISAYNGGPLTITAASGQDVLVPSPLYVFQNAGSTIPLTINIANGGAPAAINLVGPFGGVAPIEFNGGTAGMIYSQNNGNMYINPASGQNVVFGGGITVSHAITSSSSVSAATFVTTAPGGSGDIPMYQGN